VAQPCFGIPLFTLQRCSLDAPFVEYKGKIPPAEQGPLLQKLQLAFQELLDEDIATEILVLDKAEAQERCDRIKENYFNFGEFGEDEPIRLVSVAGWTCPCGGTHVKSTGPLKQRKWGITGLKCKKGILKIKYNQDWESCK
jgi:Ser-tRNA(Ala) deacylase AlaX